VLFLNFCLSRLKDTIPHMKPVRLKALAAGIEPQGPAKLVLLQVDVNEESEKRWRG